MARKRYLSSDTSTDPRIADLAQFGVLPALLYTWAIPHADDWGRLTGDARQFRMLVCPALDVTAAEVDEALDQIADVGLWERYEAGGRKVIAFPKEAWFRHQSYIAKAKREEDRSQFPPPPSQGRKATPSTDERRTPPTNSDEHRITPQNPASPSPSPTPSPTREEEDARAREAILAGWAQGTKESGKNAASGCLVLEPLLEMADDECELALLRELAREAATKDSPEGWGRKVFPNLRHSNVKTLADLEARRQRMQQHRSRAAPAQAQAETDYPDLEQRYAHVLGGDPHG